MEGAQLIGWIGRKLANMVHGGNRWVLGFGGGRRGRYDYAREVGMGLDASVIMAPVQWLQRAMVEAPVVVERRADSGELVPDHALARIVERPNPFYSGTHLWQATMFSLCVDGNGYWIKVRNGNRRVVELWYVPHWMMEPKWPDDGSAFITHYNYTPRGEAMRIGIDDVIHFRVGIHPRNARLGLAPLRAALTDVWADMEAGAFVAALLRNSGVPGLILSPDGPVAANPDDVAQIKRYLKENFTGDSRGDPMVLSAKTKVDKIGFNPQELDLSGASNRAEERVCALLGIPSSVIGFRSGNTQTKVGATMREQVRLAWSNAVLPMQALCAEELERSLLPDFAPRPQELRVYFDTREVKALAEDDDALVRRANAMVAGGWIQVGEARQMIGMESDATHAIYLRSFGTVEVPGQTGRREADDVGLRAAPPTGRKHAHTTFEERIAREAPHAEPSAAQSAFVRALEAAGLTLATAHERRLTAFFRDLGDQAAAAAAPVLAEMLKSTGGAGTKQELLDEMITERVIEAMQLPAAQRLFGDQAADHYLRVARNTAKQMAVLGLATDMADPVARAVIATGGRRAGLVDLAAQTRERVLVAVAEARAAGEGVDQIAREIADQVSSGRFHDPRTRARLIARTETKYAQNVSVVEHATANGVTQFIISDARLGETDIICMLIDGAIVSAEEARELMELEHPNGTRSMTPYFG